MSKKEENLDFDFSSVLGGFASEGDNREPFVLSTDELFKDEETEEVEDTQDIEDTEDTEDTGEEVEEVENSEEEDTENDLEDEDTVEYSFKALASYLAEEGVIDFEDSDDIEDSPELLKKVVAETAMNMVSEYKESIPEIGRQFLDYLEKGGDPNKFIESITAPLDLNNIDLENIDNQKAVITAFLKEQNYTPEEIADEIADYEDGLILEKRATTALSKLKKIHDKKAEELVKQQEAMAQESQKQYEKYLDDVRTTIQSSDSLGGLKVSNQEKKEFEKYLLQVGSDGKTQYEKDVLENPIKTQVELAYLKYKKFDFSKVASKVKTEESRRLKNIFKTKETTPKGAGSKSNVEDNAADLGLFDSLLR